MLQSILVAIDRSSANRKVFEEAVLFAKATKAKIILIHVLSAEEPNSPVMSLGTSTKGNHHYTHLNPKITQSAYQIYRKQWKDFEIEGQKILRSFADIAISQGIETEFTQITGHPCSTICEFAQSCHADVIVIGRRGYSKIREILLGSVSNYVVHHAPCSVLLVQTPLEKKHQPLKETVKPDIYA